MKKRRIAFLALTVAVLAVMVIVAAPHIRQHYQSVRCSNQMILVCFGAITWAEEHESRLPPDLQCLSNEVILTQFFVCPGDHSRQAAANWSSLTASNISYEIAPPGLRFGDTSNAFLRCRIHGHVGYGDGAVYDASGRLRKPNALW